MLIEKSKLAEANAAPMAGQDKIVLGLIVLATITTVILAVTLLVKAYS